MSSSPTNRPIPTLDIPVGAIHDLIRNVAQDEIIPRFRNLSAEAIGEKRPGETVTEADTAAEMALAAGIRSLVANAVIVGEEGVELEPALLSRLDEPGPVFVLDPVDGTQNFSEEEDVFAVIVAFRRGGETLAGWIYDPVADVMCHAVSQGGAHFDDGRPIIRAQGPGLSALSGCLGKRARRALENKIDEPKPRLTGRYRCVGREYFDLCSGALDFVQFGQRLKPWDHAAGALIVEEAGFAAAMVETGSAYKPGPEGIIVGNFLVAPDQQTWESLRALIA